MRTPRPVRSLISRFAILAACLALLAPERARAAGRSGAPPQRLAYICNLMSHTVSVIDLDKREWVRDLSAGRYPVFASVHPHDPAKLLVALHNYERTEDDDALVLLDLKTGTVVKKVPFPGPGMPSGFVHDPKRDRLYIADENLHRIFALDGATLEPLFDFPAGLIPVHVDVSPDGRWLAATNRKSANLYVYDLDNAARSAKDGIYTIPLGPAPGLRWESADPNAPPESHPLDVKFGSRSQVCYVTDLGTSELLIVDISARRVTGRIALTSPPFDMALTRNRATAYIGHVTGDAITVVDLTKKSIVATIEGISPNPIHCALDEAHGLLIAAGWGTDQRGGVHLIDLKTRKILKTLLPDRARSSVGIAIPP